jgi:hypothetical protein
MRGALENQGEWPGPESVDEAQRFRRQLLDPICRVTMRREMHDHRMIRRPPFRRVDARNGIRTLGIAAEAIDGLSGKRDELACVKQRRSVCDFRGTHNRASRGNASWLNSFSAFDSARSTCRFSGFRRLGSPASSSLGSTLSRFILIRHDPSASALQDVQ